MGKKLRSLTVLNAASGAEIGANLITHGGTFHADEVMSTAILMRTIPGSDPLVVARMLGNESILDVPGAVVYDVGGGEFDHHQKGGNGERENGIPYSSCGLIWRKFGHILCRNTINPDYVWTAVDKELIAPIDAQDCGYRGDPVPDGVKLAPIFTFSQMISAMNVNWNESSSTASSEHFVLAVNVAMVALDAVLSRAIGKAEAKKVVESAILESENGIVSLMCYAPWQEYIFPDEDADEKLKRKAKEALYVVYPGNRGGHQFRVVPDKPGSFGQRIYLPEVWRGLKGEELRKITGVETATFVHPAGFIGGAEDALGCLHLARLAIELGTRG